MMAAYRNEKRDSVLGSIYSRYLARGAAEREIRNNGLGILDFCPAATLLAPPWHMLPGYVSEIHGVEFRIEYKWESGTQIEARNFETPVGSVSQQIRREGGYGSDYISKHYVSTPQDYEVMQYIVERTVILPNHKMVQGRIDALGDDGVVLGRLDRNPFQKMLIEIADPQQFLMDMVSGLQAAEDLLQLIAERLDEQAAMACDSPAEVIWQPDNVTCDMTSPTFFAKYNLPLYKRNAERFHAAGKVYAVHMDGRLGPLRDMIRESGVDVIESFSLPVMGNDMTLPEAQAAWPDQAVTPNFPSTLSLKSDDDIQDFMSSVIETRVPDTALMVQVSEDLPREHYQRVCKLLSEMRR
jgi:hypothetical protein